MPRMGLHAQAELDSLTSLINSMAEQTKWSEPTSQSPADTGNGGESAANHLPEAAGELQVHKGWFEDVLPPTRTAILLNTQQAVPKQVACMDHDIHHHMLWQTPTTSTCPVHTLHACRMA
jgi:hypothetical protein